MVAPHFSALNRRRFISLAAISGSAAALAACGGGSDGDSTSKGKTDAPAASGEAARLQMPD